MKWTIQLASVCFASILVVLWGPQVVFGEIIAGPFEWSVGSGGNGHFYELVNRQAAISWTDAQNDAASRVFNGSAGHLVTITSPGENDFLKTSFQSFIGDPNTGVPGIYAWIGLSDAANEGTFVWVTGEPFSYSNWFPGEPNNLGNEDFVSIWRRNFGSGPLWSWNDFNVFPNNDPVYGGFIVEFDGPFTVPEPASLAIWGGLGLVGLFAARRRRLKQAASA